jgi:superfamily I DNA/RNA helicase
LRLSERIRPCQQIDKLNFDEVCDRVGELLERQEVCDWIATRFPVLIVDEAQDLDPTRLRILKALAGRTLVLSAADEFQDLWRCDVNESVEWLRANAEIETLNQIHRTKCAALLTAATAVRQSQMPSVGKGFAIKSAPTHNLAAWFVALAVAARSGGTLAVLSPSKAPFSIKAIIRVGESPIGKKPKFGPYNVPWERDGGDEVQELLNRLSLPENCTARMLREIAHQIDHPICRQLRTWAQRLAVYSSKECVTKVDVEKKIEEFIHLRQRFHRSEAGVTAMTIHQAKNREFDHVVLLWPILGTKWTKVQKQRLLYNGITRARLSCTVVVHEPKKKNRLFDELFS